MTRKLHNGKEELSTITDEPGSLNLRSGKYSGLDIDIRRNSVQDADRILRVRLAMDGCDDTKFFCRLDQVEALVGKVAVSTFSRFDKEVIYKERWTSSIYYCLPIIQFTDKQCDTI